MKTQHTPGLWEIDDTNPDEVKIICDDKIIATIERGDGITHKEQKANTRLIKYAPTLRNCTENLAHKYEQMFNYFQHRIKPEDLKSMRAQIAEVRKYLILIKGE